MLNWVNRFNICCLLDNQQYANPSGRYECIAGAGALHLLITESSGAFQRLNAFQQTHADWLFGHLGYDLKNDVENLHSAHFDGVGFPDMCFFVPQVVLLLEEHRISVGLHGYDHQRVYDEIINTAIPAPTTSSAAVVQQRFSREEYIATVEQLQRHITKGDCYEINFCQEFYVESIHLDPPAMYQALSGRNPNPFAAYYRLNDRYCLCASPERFIRKDQDRLYSQPVKGTAPRYTDPRLDEASRTSLLSSEKERSENVMVVDLVRNDLSRVCLQGSVQVTELFGIYSFPQVHQMISTISGIPDPALPVAELIRACFPMGSMTGAPKKRVMELIEQYERSRRGLYSGAIGYITPDADFDFNVVIRSMLYNAESAYLSWQTGAAITSNSDAAKEYEECLLKGLSMQSVIEGIKKNGKSPQAEDLP